MFPILGGRLLKSRGLEQENFPLPFPILGGRLLKKSCYSSSLSPTNVSNPWREAIEDYRLTMEELLEYVSNPWREAIEEILLKMYVVRGGFPILGGRLLKICLDCRHSAPAQCFQSLEGGY